MSGEIHSFDDFLALFPDRPRKKIAGGYKVICPCHADRDPSLALTLKGDAIGVKDFGGCPTEDILEAKGLTFADLFLNSQKPKVTERTPKKLVGTYSYQDASSVEEYQIRRFEPKDFQVWHKNKSAKYVLGLGEANPIPYRLPELLQAIKYGKTVYLPEGEGKVDRLVALGLTATTSPFGAGPGKWLPEEYNPFFVGAKVVILSDNDSVGIDFAEEKARNLITVAKSIKLLLLPNLPPKGDVIDWLDKGHTVDELKQLADACPDYEPSDNRVKLHLGAVLDGVVAFLKRFVRFSNEHQVVAVALWLVHTHVFNVADTTPYLSITSPEKRSGKTRLLEVLELLVRRPWRAVLPSEAVLFRKTERDCPALLLDEVDAIFRNPPPLQYEPLRALLNAGHRRGVKVPRCVGKGAEMELKEFSVFCPKALVGLGKLPPTVADRSIPIRLARRAPGEEVEPFRYREAEEEGRSIRGALAAWAGEAMSRLREARPQIPSSLNDRASEGWEPLLAIADEAGGEWPQRARDAAIALHGEGEADSESTGVLLLGAVRNIFEERRVERLSTADLLKGLVDREEGPWAEWWGKSVRDGDTKGPAHRLAKLLRPYGIVPKTIRLGDSTFKGYLEGDFRDAFERYLPSSAMGESNKVTPLSGSDTGEDSEKKVTEGDMLPSFRHRARYGAEADVTMLPFRTFGNGGGEEDVEEPEAEGLPALEGLPDDDTPSPSSDPPCVKGLGTCGLRTDVNKVFSCAFTPGDCPWRHP